VIHVIDPGNVPDGLFWTEPIPSDSVHVHLDKKKPTASLRVQNIATRDWGTVPNDLLHGPSVPATLSFEVQWKGLIKPVNLRDPVNRFVFKGVEDTAVLTCSASVPKKDFEFVSDAAGQKVGFAEIGHERNGSFFPDDDDDNDDG
jgi:hypothetical protein